MLIIGWHFPTTFFVPGGTPHERRWLIWPFGRRTPLVVDAIAVWLALSQGDALTRLAAR